MSVCVSDFKMVSLGFIVKVGCLYVWVNYLGLNWLKMNKRGFCACCCFVYYLMVLIDKIDMVLKYFFKGAKCGLSMSYNLFATRLQK